MEPKTPSEEESGTPLRLSDLAAALIQRRAELGDPDVPRNAGTHRTVSKRALLKAIRDAGGRW